LAPNLEVSMSSIVSKRASKRFNIVIGGMIGGLVGLMLLGGCVTQGTYDEMVAERDQLATRNQTLQQQRGALVGVATGLGAELAMANREVAILEQEQQELADEVARWAVRGAIEMHLLKDGLHLILPHDVLFESGSSTLSAEGQELVTELVAELEKQPYQIAVLGFTDNVPVGPSLLDRYPSNWDLAGARATSVVRLMDSEGIPASQLVAVSRGQTGAIASNDTPEGRSQNRRIDVRIRPVLNR
jgi:chemotaxis protein MotB